MKKYIWILIVIILLAFFFYPKQYVKGGAAGLIGPGESYYKEEWSCYGIKHSYYPKGCADCSNVYNCYGWTHEKKCYTEKVLDFEGKISKEPAICKS